jgi:hypothetical protein
VHPMLLHLASLTWTWEQCACQLGRKEPSLMMKPSYKPLIIMNKPLCLKIVA